ncbi:TPA: LysR family transcriptional regulator [Streptococcus agalactiae]|uniref:HTH lysR-type domain-containing protein n=5 Tax=Streptococcus agalactiae TaxID=1311 RepID=Q8E421_STRA3|nr:MULTISPECIES: LysR family transcriptional regulator [Streptococcus]EPT70231.1 LysR family transcriptional regulator [Streptococcus agalactiae CCUG 38383]ALB16467.1 LysR family transcriptional regulator [Streptococcus agalactiae]ANR97492.1 LysR family transcriptional regulator [Streptococcus agalactiae]EMA8744440.1 LysR family transcriptional regulator [Streptococcus agalactiae]EPT38533.1 LysR family transcriptional regulator [Streptococcus agalactiae FSL C1-494]
MKNQQKLMYLESIELYSNITKAAAHLFISQPYLSKVIKQLENELKIKLIQSQGHQTFLTYAGQRYLFYLKEIDMIERQMAKELYLIRSDKKGEITLGINSGLASSILANVLPKFNLEHPEISVKLLENNQNISEQLVASGDIDLAVGMAPIVYKDGIASTTIYRDELFLMIPTTSQLYNAEKRGQIIPFEYPISVLDNEPLILTPLEYGIGKTIAQFYELHHMSLNQMITTSTVPTAASLSLSGMGATFVPQTLIHRYLDKECNVYHFHKNKLFSEYIMIYKKDVELSGIALLLYKAFLTK